MCDFEEINERLSDIHHQLMYTLSVCNITQKRNFKVATKVPLAHTVTSLSNIPYPNPKT